MRNITLAIIFLFTIIGNLAWAHAPLSPPSAGVLPQKVTLTAGTLVSLETAERVFSGQVTVGQLIKFKVSTNVLVNRRVVITTGAIATGRVKTITQATYNSPESITVELSSVQAVDGQKVSLNGTEQTFTGVFPNESLLVYPGKAIEANVMNDIVIVVK